ncbi:ferritin-like domain-containing protein [Halostreptopolyspora alba]|uniref:Iminophenyl-pyruvate dimer synthase domain-containing protein n=1 Tax=Halostreptopolyspora alba TaxID=2487137 RepID=A0A3N0EDW1_9ACTN|nr:hypothetical protein EFW17_05590 [Nocardiopsaceae bacterium YIM 96095]
MTTQDTRQDLGAVYTTPDALKGVTNKQELFSHLYDAARLEMQTIPMYLYAAYSIKTENVSQWAPGPGAFRLIRTVVTEEMLHLSLVRNLIISIGYGDRIRFCDPNFISTYPAKMLHRKPDLELHTAPLTPKLVRDMFMEFEKPTKKDAPPKTKDYETIGQFYKAVWNGFAELGGIVPDKAGKDFASKAAPDQVFKHDPEKEKELFKDNEPYKQYVETYWNEGGGGDPVLVKDIKSAFTAINMIVEQGEGAGEDKQHVPIHPEAPKEGYVEEPHYIKFKRIADKWEPIGDVHPVPTNPRVENFPEGPVQDLGLLCNAAYTYVLRILDEIYNAKWDDVEPGNTSRRYGLERKFIAAMQGLLFGVIKELVKTPITSGEYKGKNAAPTFQFYHFPEDEPMVTHMKELCNKVIPDYPELGGDNSVLWLLGKMPDLYPEHQR